MTIPYKFYYDAQFKKYIGQFLKIFSGIQVQDGVDRDGDGVNDLRPVYIVYGNPDRVIAQVVMQNKATFTNQKIPIISGYLTGIKQADEARMSKHHIENVTYQSTADSQYHTLSRIAPVPYDMSMDLHIYASNTDQMFQILEQILLWFNPSINFQKSSAVTDWTYITRCTLTGIQDQTNYPMGTAPRVIVQTLNFEFTAWLNYPYLDDTGSIQTIIANMLDSTLVVEDLDTVTPPPAGAHMDTTTITSTTPPESGPPIPPSDNGN